jgi:type I restriction enzyme S subunit
VNYNKNSFGEGIKVIGVSNFQDYFKPKYTELDQINPDGIITERNILRDGDIVFVRSNGNRELIGRSLFIENPPEEITHSAFTIRVRFSNPDSICPKFFAYCFRTPIIRQALTAQGGGTNINNLNQDILGALQVPNPNLQIQNRIVAILSSYDDLIENCQRRIRILETMARSLYREWFVNFKFPEYEKVKMVSSKMGKIPEGWEVKRVPECVLINPRVTVPREGGRPFVPMGCLSNDTMLITNIEFREGNNGAKFQNGDTLFARITPCLENGKTGFVQFLPDDKSVACGSTEFIVLRSHTLTPEFVYCLARSNEFRDIAIKSMSGATGRQRVQEKCFNDFQFAQGPGTLLDKYSAIVAPIFSLIYSLHLKIQNLRRTRDLLLPRILSGQVDTINLTKDNHA